MFVFFSESLESGGDSLESCGESLESSGDSLESSNDSLESGGDSLDSGGDSLESCLIASCAPQSSCLSSRLANIVMAVLWHPGHKIPLR